ncbi:EF-P 5-aminopentanol modification-associated protein YfmH [Lysinibacillus fusiformis]|uniref:EF-P 5-aminopentanol modification-associated protein YfmH n=1 Tax=Lysinibacillus fusiformis TaxID=28031 RepID=UPI0000F38006|nr:MULTISPECIES: pitrilysin family protein [Lysinibacillus]EAZ84782.1 Zinc protease [Bacillus sp. B14905]MED4074914.1 pitrilysin family protein [Lysinibacillus fusiformis]MED4668729.1 pitrilysin family protein [Lysinibacillus fusiformis]PCD83813.1 insulinase family protein [Lysinibacillus fusiformis]QAS59109.1 insulinase family protein [Lysinibacillus sphaericus]
MKTIEFKQLDETLYYEKLENGLDVYILPKKGFSKTFVTFTTKYGSIDRTFVPIGQTESITVPDGIAHFLEHKMFEKEDGDVFQKFSEYGASANAFTSFTRTAYLFSSTDNIYKSTETLLNFVQEPYFTEATVNKEKGIIGQEITMYDDQPDWRLYFGTIENMYHHHPVKIDIAGTIESIDGITADHLYTCYNTFYHPSNMLLFVIGAVDPEEMMTFIRDNQGKKEFSEPVSIQRFFDEEPTEVAINERTLNMDVQKPKVYVGLKAKETNLSGREMLKHELSVQIALELIFGRTSNFYERVYEEGLIDETYAFDFTLENGFGFAMIGSDSSEPDKLTSVIKEELAKFEGNSHFEGADLERIKRKKIGFFLRALNSIEFIANQFTRYSFNDMNLFDVVPVLEELTVDDLYKAFASVQGESQQTVFKILPSKQDA